VLRAIGEKCYLVRFDDGQEKECSSNILKVESSSANLSPDMLLPVHEVTRDMSAVEEAAGIQMCWMVKKWKTCLQLGLKKKMQRQLKRRGIHSKQTLLMRRGVPNNNAEDDAAMPNNNAENEIRDPNG
jgi:hypothetical protein